MVLNVQPGIVLVAVNGETEEVLDSGLIVTSRSTARNMGRITHIHPSTSEDYDLSVGDEVVFNPFSVREISIGAGETRMGLSAGDIIGTITATSDDVTIGE